jgi:hypothetical protein
VWRRRRNWEVLQRGLVVRPCQHRLCILVHLWPDHLDPEDSAYVLPHRHIRAGAEPLYAFFCPSNPSSVFPPFVPTTTIITPPRHQVSDVFSGFAHGSTGKKEGFVCLCMGCRVSDCKSNMKSGCIDGYGHKLRLARCLVCAILLYIWYIAVAPDPTHKVADR